MDRDKLSMVSKLQVLRENCPKPIMDAIISRLGIGDDILDLNPRLLFFYTLELMHYFNIVEILDSYDREMEKNLRDVGYHGTDPKSKSIQYGFPCMVQITDKDLFTYLIDKFYLVDTDKPQDYSAAYDKCTSEIGWGIYCPDFYKKIKDESAWKRLLETKKDRITCEWEEYFASLPFPIIKPFISKGSIIEYLAFNPDIERGWRNRYVDPNVNRIHEIDTEEKMSIFYDIYQGDGEKKSFDPEINDTINSYTGSKKNSIGRKKCNDTIYRRIKANLKLDLEKKLKDKAQSRSGSHLDRLLSSPQSSQLTKYLLKPGSSSSPLHHNIFDGFNEDDEDVDRDYHEVFAKIAFQQFKSWDNAFTQYDHGKKVKEAMLKKIVANEESAQRRKVIREDKIILDNEINMKNLLKRIELSIKPPLKQFKKDYNMFGRNDGALMADDEWSIATDNTVSSILGQFFHRIRRSNTPTDITKFQSNVLNHGESIYLSETWLFNFEMKPEPDKTIIYTLSEKMDFQNIITDLNNLIDRVLYAPEFIDMNDIMKQNEILINTFRKMGGLASFFLRYSIIKLMELKKRDMDEILKRMRSGLFKHKKTSQILQLIETFLIFLKRSWKVIEEKEEINLKRPSGGKLARPMEIHSGSQRKIFYMDIDENDLSNFDDLQSFTAALSGVERHCSIIINRKIDTIPQFKTELGQREGYFIQDANGREVYEELEEDDGFIRHVGLINGSNLLHEYVGERDVPDSIYLDGLDDDANIFANGIFEGYKKLNGNQQKTTLNIIKKQMQGIQNKHYLQLIDTIVASQLEDTPAEWFLGEFGTNDNMEPIYTIVFPENDSLQISFENSVARPVSQKIHLPLSVLLWFVPIQYQGLSKLKEFYYQEFNSISKDADTTSPNAMAKYDFDWLRHNMDMMRDAHESPEYHFDIKRVIWSVDNKVRKVIVNIRLTEGETEITLDMLLCSENGAEKLCTHVYKDKTLSLTENQEIIIFNEVLSHNFGRQAMCRFIATVEGNEDKIKWIRRYRATIKNLKKEKKIEKSTYSLDFSDFHIIMLSGDDEEDDDDDVYNDEVYVSSPIMVDQGPKTTLEERKRNIIKRYTESHPAQPLYVITIISKHLDKLCKAKFDFFDIIEKITQIDSSEWSLGDILCNDRNYGMVPLFHIIFKDSQRSDLKLPLNTLLWFIPIQETAIVKLREYYQEPMHDIDTDISSFQIREFNIRNGQRLKEIVSDTSSLHFPSFIMQLKNITLDPDSCTILNVMSKSTFTIPLNDFVQQDTAKIAIEQYISSTQSQSKNQEIVYLVQQYNRLHPQKQITSLSLKRSVSVVDDLVSLNNTGPAKISKRNSDHLK